MNRRVAACLVLVGLMTVGLAGCHLFEGVAEVELVQSDKPRDSNPQVERHETAQLVQGNTEFALDLFQALREEKGNLFYSPYSISTALAMAYAGARGETETQMAHTLRFTLAPERLHPAFNALALDLERRAEESHGEFKLTVANSFWGQQGYPLLPDYLDVLAVNYGAGVRLVDFASAPEACRRAINEWVREETYGTIPSLFPPGAISSMTRLVLADAIYLKALWPTPFQEELTVDRPFHLLDGDVVRVPTMEERMITAYAQGDDYRAVVLHLRGGCSVFIIMPEEGSYQEFEASLNAEKLDSIRDAIGIYDVHLFLPKFSYRSRFDLSRTLSALGMVNAFSRAADFSGMDGTRELLISGVVHEAFVGVDEYGIEAGGATGLPWAGSPPPPPPAEMRIDRPFIFMIRDWSGMILFMGRVLDATAG